MKLLSASVTNFKRFHGDNSVRLNERLIAFVGPNEAGKSSILQALRQSASPTPIDARDQTRRSQEAAAIKSIFALNEGDYLALKPIPEASQITRCTIIKTADGRLSMLFEPAVTHDLEPRKILSPLLGEIAKLPSFLNFGNTNEDRTNRRTRLQNLIKILDLSDDYFGKERIQTITAQAAEFKAISTNASLSQQDRDVISKAAELLGHLAAHEEASIPEAIRRVLQTRIPPIYFFDDAARDLKTTYDLTKITKEIPVALANISKICGLNIHELKRATEKQDQAYRRELINEANRKLETEFSVRWVRKDVIPQFDYDEGGLQLYVRVADTAALSRIEERSDGLRWFIALVAFLSGKEHPEKPILLVDEAETHLSYDAQASLMDTLEKQNIAQKVIYTTHSAGCLPADLGTGVRAVIPLKNGLSKIENGFWIRGEGFSPLLLTMGLGPLAFTVARNELIAEGPSECLLLPTLLREVTELERLSFQVAPGASNVDPKNIDGLLNESGRAAFILDGDEGGRAIRQKLLDCGVKKERILVYSDVVKTDVQFEDFVSTDAYVKAFNHELIVWQNTNVRLSTQDIPITGRAKAVDEWCVQKGLKLISKPSLCQFLAEMARDGEKIVAAHRKDSLRKIHSWISECFSGRK